MERMALKGIKNKFNPAEAPKIVKGLNLQKGWQTMPTLVKGSTFFLKPRYCEKLHYPFFSRPLHLGKPILQPAQAR